VLCFKLVKVTIDYGASDGGYVPVLSGTRD